MTMTMAPPKTETHFAITCDGVIKKGRLAGDRCGKLLARPRVQFWEQDLSSEAILTCDKCGDDYRLADYLRPPR